ncbi:tropomyosin alpha-1 chain-like isoform x3 protein, partial [Lasius niger]
MNIEEEDIIIIEDKENEADVIVIENKEKAIENEDMDIDVEEVNNEEESSDDEIRILEDSNYDSECNEDFSEKQVRILKRADIHDIDELQKMCCISFYYEIDNG